MIFVTVGTHEQQFNRLIEKIDNLKQSGKIKESVVMQTGYSDYISKNCTTYDFMSHDEMKQFIRNARIVITHGGPSSFLDAIMLNKKPIIVPRYLEYGEHVNNHQVDFLRKISNKLDIYPVYDINDLEFTIDNYQNIGSDFGKSNNICFNELIEMEIKKLLK